MPPIPYAALAPADHTAHACCAPSSAGSPSELDSLVVSSVSGTRAGTTVAVTIDAPEVIQRANDARLQLQAHVAPWRARLPPLLAMRAWASAQSGIRPSAHQC